MIDPIVEELVDNLYTQVQALNNTYKLLQENEVHIDMSFTNLYLATVKQLEVRTISQNVTYTQPLENTQ